MTRKAVIAGLLLGLAVELLLAAPGAAEVQIGISIGTPSPVVVAPPPPPPPVVVTAPPLVVVPGTAVCYAPAVPYNFFFFAGRYYTFHDGAWFYATIYNGPWVFLPVEHVPPPVLAVPVAYYRVPAGHWKKGGPPPSAGHGRKKWKEHDD